MVAADLKKKSIILLGSLALLALSNSALAISDCAIGLPQVSAPVPDIDGQISGGEWGGASVLDSNTSSCLDSLIDRVGTVYTSRRVIVHSKRYVRDGQPMVGFAFEIDDASPCVPTGTSPDGTPVNCAGEQLVLQFNPLIGNVPILDEDGLEEDRDDNGLDFTPPNMDKRIIVKHFWMQEGGPGIPDVGVHDIQGYLDTVIGDDADLICPLTNPDYTLTRFFGEGDDTGIDYAIRGDTGAEYLIEIEVPEELIKPGDPGILETDIGVAFAIINDFAVAGLSPDLPDDPSACGAGTPCEAAGTSFPSTLPTVNGRQPFSIPCQAGWTRPREWGVGYLEEPPGTLSFERDPFWSSSSINVYECDSLGYTYYPAQPCRVRIEANIKNTGAAQTKKVAFFWAKHGTGDPSRYNFVGIKDVTVAPGTVASPVSTPVTTDEWDGMPVGEANHPCLRAYILPDDFDNSLLPEPDGEILREELISIISVPDHHWAQKNISVHPTVTVCPRSGCGIANGQQGLFDGIRVQLIPGAYAQESSERARTVALDEGGNNFIRGDLNIFEKDVIVQVKTFAHRLLPKGNEGPYNFVEDFGGVVQVFPLEMVQQNATLPVEFLVSNFSESAMAVQIVPEVYTPDPSLKVKVDVGERFITLQPGTETVVKGKLVDSDLDPGGPGEEGECKWPAFLCDLSAIHILLLILLLIVIAVVIKKLRPSP